MSFSIRPLQAEDAKALFGMIYQTGITDTLLWDGPTDEAEYASAIEKKAAKMAAGEKHAYTILSQGEIAGMIDLRPYENGFAADIGLWIGKQFHGQGLATQAIGFVTQYAFEKLGLEKVEGYAFVGNEGSKRAFEKNGFIQEGIWRMKIKKRGKYIDEYAFGILRSEFEARKKS